MEKICEDSPFWDHNLSWNTTGTPDLTDCFQSTVCLWVPCGFLLISLPYQIYQQEFAKRDKCPWNLKNITKLVVLVVMLLLDLSLAANDGINERQTPLISRILLSAAYFLIILLVLRDRSHGIHSSGSLFVFWILHTIGYSIIYRSHVIKTIYSEISYDVLPLGLHLALYPLIVFQLFLSCFADNPAINDLKSKNSYGEDISSVLSQYLYWWLNSLIYKGYKKTINIDDIPNIEPKRECKEVSKRLDKQWNKEILKSKSQNKYRPSILKAVAKAFWVNLLIGSFFKLLSDILLFIGPQVLDLIISFVSSDEPQWKGLLYVFILFFSLETQSIFLSRYFFHMFTVGMEIRSAFIIAIYKKALKLSNSERQKTTVGEIVNLMSIDSQRIMDVLPVMNMMWSAPLQISLALYFLYQVLGVAVFAGISFLILLIPVNMAFGRIMNKLQIRNMKFKDERTKIMNEILSGIKVLKLYAWELPFINFILKIRDSEINILRKLAYLNAGMILTWNMAPFVVALLSFCAFVLIDDENVLTPNTAFVALSLLNIIRFPLTMLPNMASAVVQAIVSMRRIDRFMRAEELSDEAVTYTKDSGSIENIAVSLIDTSFSWDSDGMEPVLENINLEIPSGKLVAVIGQVGSGKSSFIYSLLGEMNKLKGSVYVENSISYVPQIAWIRNDKLSKNITMYKEKDDDFYNKVIKGCALSADLEILPNGDETEIGEKGLNLSGGQKQRISLARAAYHDSQLYLLDDPLSAVDPHVGKHIFDNIIGPNGLLKDKTRILVTNGVSFLPQCDMVVFLKDGTIIESGSYKELMNRNGIFSEFIRIISTKDEENLESPSEDIDATSCSSMSVAGPSPTNSRKGSNDDSTVLKTENSLLRISNPDLNCVSDETRRISLLDNDSLHAHDGSLQIGKKAKLIDSEEVAEGSVDYAVYFKYVKSIGIILSLMIVFVRTCGEAFVAASNVWLSEWSSDKLVNGTVDNELRDYRLTVYGILGLFQGVAVLLSSVGLAYGTMLSATFLHSSLLYSVMRCPMSYFETTPMGRIINRFSKDINVIDMKLVWNFNDLSGALLQILATVVVISMQTPLFLVVMVPIAAIYLFIRKIYIASSRQLRRFESTTRSPIYSHFSESLTGSVSIRAYGMFDDFLLDINRKVNMNQKCYFPTFIANRWLSIRLEFIGNLMVLFSALFAVLGRDTLGSAAVGLSVSYAMSIISELMWMVRQSSELEMNMVSVERVIEYCNLRSEASWSEVDDDIKTKDWPSEGEIKFDSYSTKYRKNLDPVLKKLTCSIMPGEKIGICGRTGAGKSSLTLALFRIIEATNGAILIDGLDIAKMGLHALRSKLTIIPQDPILFSGTLRQNLDPSRMFSDDKIWEALEHTHLKSFLVGKEDGLHFMVNEGGENLSVGQRQLICLARALLRKSKILILDEATASIDLETDDFIQDTIKKEFEECTVLTIAHRLNTIMDSSRIMVLKDGNIAEFDKPESLLSDHNTIFYELAQNAGLI